MPATPLADMIARMRNDLHDNDATAYRWTDAILQRHIERAVKDYSFAVPIEVKTTLVTVASSRDIDIATPTALTNILAIDRVEYPVGYYPPIYVRWQLWDTRLTLLVEDLPNAANNVYVYWRKIHSITTSATTLPTNHEPIVETGAEAYALLEWANYAPNRVNVGGEKVWADYKALGEQKLAEFKQFLRDHGYKGKLRTQQIQPI